MPDQLALSTLLPPQERLDTLVDMLDPHQSATGGHTVFRVVDHHGGTAVERLELTPGEHPCLALLGLTAENHWWATGVKVNGRAHKLDDDLNLAGREPSPMRLTHFVARTGEEAYLLHIAGVAQHDPGPAEGKLSDLCRRVFGLPTDPPPAGPGALWTVMWLDRVRERCEQPAQRRELSRSWSAIARLHPAFDGADSRRARPNVVRAGRALAERHSWSDLRHGARPVPITQYACELLPEDGLWFDDGSYARWTVGAFRSASELVVDLYGLLGEMHGDHLVHCTRRLLAPPGDQ